MKKIIDVLRFIFISPEIVVGLIVLVLLTKFPTVPSFISSFLFNQEMKWDDYLKLLGLPVTTLIFTYKFGEAILNPEDVNNRKKLKLWSHYWMLKNRIYFSIIVSFLVSAGSLVCWYYALNINIVNGTIALLGLWSISLTSFLTVSLAKLAIKDILY